MKEDFVAWLVEELRTRGWPQAEFARRAEISPATVSRVLSGENNPGEDFLVGAARALGVPVEEVMRRAGKLPDYGEVLPQARAWSDRLKQLSPEDRARAETMIEQVLRFAEDRPEYRVRRTR